jgi:dihydropteroate synthase type 2
LRRVPPTRPKIVGIVNVTEDSFSDGGRYLEPERAYARCLELTADGADVVELGAASSNPDAKLVPAAEEIRRLEPHLARLVERGIPVAVDSSAPETQAFALARGASLLNDVRGFPDPARYPELARARARLVVMHAV